MILLLIRHGESEADLLDIHEGRADFSLTERGRKQAEKLANYLNRRYEITKIYSSTLMRAKQTAEYIGKKMGVEIFLNEDLMEFNNGLLAGLKREVAREKYPEVKGLATDKSVYGMESKKEFRERAERVLRKIIEENDEKDVVALISHGGMINQFYGVMLGLTLDTRIAFGTGDTGFHVWKITNNKLVVWKTNEMGHLKE